MCPVPLKYENSNTGHSVIVPIRVLEFRQVYFDDGDLGYADNYVYGTNFIPNYVGVCCDGDESFAQGNITIYPVSIQYSSQTKYRWISKLNSKQYDYYLEVADPDLDEEYAAISSDRISVANPVSVGGEMTQYTSPIPTQDLPDRSDNYLYSNNGHDR